LLKRKQKESPTFFSSIFLRGVTWSKLLPASQSLLYVTPMSDIGCHEQTSPSQPASLHQLASLPASQPAYASRPFPGKRQIDLFPWCVLGSLGFWVALFSNPEMDLESPWGSLGLLWDLLGVPWGVLGGSLGLLGAPLGSPGGSLGSPRGLLGPPWDSGLHFLATFCEPCLRPPPPPEPPKN
jgi:hypothetical protein